MSVLDNEALCEAMRLKMAKALPAEVMPEFQIWVSLEQDIAYARGQKDEADARDTPQYFVQSGM